MTKEEREIIRAAAEAVWPRPHWHAAMGHVEAPETEDYPHIDINCRSGSKDDAKRLSRFIAAANPEAVLGLIAALEEAEKDAGRKQARIDELMLEYCPDEMTSEQTANWAKHQVPADAEIAELADGLSKQARINQTIDAALSQKDKS